MLLPTEAELETQINALLPAKKAKSLKALEKGYQALNTVALTARSNARLAPRALEVLEDLAFHAATEYIRVQALNGIGMISEEVRSPQAQRKVFDLLVSALEKPELFPCALKRLSSLGSRNAETLGKDTLSHLIPAMGRLSNEKWNDLGGTVTILEIIRKDKALISYAFNLMAQQPVNENITQCLGHGFMIIPAAEIRASFAAAVAPGEQPSMLNVIKQEIKTQAKPAPAP